MNRELFQQCLSYPLEFKSNSAYVPKEWDDIYARVYQRFTELVEKNEPFYDLITLLGVLPGESLPSYTSLFGKTVLFQPKDTFTLPPNRPGDARKAAELNYEKKLSDEKAQALEREMEKRRILAAKAAEQMREAKVVELTARSSQLKSSTETAELQVQEAKATLESRSKTSAELLQKNEEARAQRLQSEREAFNAELERKAMEEKEEEMRKLQEENSRMRAIIEDGVARQQILQKEEERARKDLEALQLDSTQPIEVPDVRMDEDDLASDDVVRQESAEVAQAREALEKLQEPIVIDEEDIVNILIEDTLTNTASSVANMAHSMANIAQSQFNLNGEEVGNLFLVLKTLLHDPSMLARQSYLLPVVKEIREQQKRFKAIKSTRSFERSGSVLDPALARTPSLAPNPRNMVSDPPRTPSVAPTTSRRASNPLTTPSAAPTPQKEASEQRMRRPVDRRPRPLKSSQSQNPKHNMIKRKKIILTPDVVEDSRPSTPAPQGLSMQ